MKFTRAQWRLIGYSVEDRRDSITGMTRRGQVSLTENERVEVGELNKILSEIEGLKSICDLCLAHQDKPCSDVLEFGDKDNCVCCNKERAKL